MKNMPSENDALCKTAYIITNARTSPWRRLIELEQLNLWSDLEMADLAEFEIPSAILAAALVEKSELKGEALENYAIHIQRRLIRQMSFSRERMEDEKKGKQPTS